jgi:hypothetical protein
MCGLPTCGARCPRFSACDTVKEIAGYYLRKQPYTPQQSDADSSDEESFRLIWHLARTAVAQSSVNSRKKFGSSFDLWDITFRPSMKSRLPSPARSDCAAWRRTPSRRALGVVLNRCSSRMAPDSSSMQYQLERSPRSSPTVNFCSEIFLLAFAAAVLPSSLPVSFISCA